MYLSEQPADQFSAAIRAAPQVGFGTVQAYALGQGVATPTRLTVAGFARHQPSVSSLPPTEQARLRSVARTIVDSFAPGNFPVLSVMLVGHADRDMEQGPKFEATVSLERATAVRNSLVAETRALARGLHVAPNAPTVAAIRWDVKGMGTQQVAIPNPTNEGQRARNRRVEIFLIPATFRMPPVPTAFSWRDAAQRGLALLPKSGLHPVQSSRLDCLLKKVLEHGVVDAYLAYDWNVRQQVACVPPELAVKFLKHVRADLGSRSGFGPDISDAAFAKNLVGIDQVIRHGIEKIDEHVNVFGAAADCFKRRMRGWIVENQRNPRSIYWCYGGGQR